MKVWRLLIIVAVFAVAETSVRLERQRIASATASGPNLQTDPYREVKEVCMKTNSRRIIICALLFLRI